MASDQSNNDYVNKLHEEIARKEAEKQALLEEFRTSISSNSEWTPEDLKKKFNGLLETAYERLLHLLHNADSEAVQLSTVKFIFSVGLGQVKITDANDPDKAVRDLLEGLVTTKK